MPRAAPVTIATLSFNRMLRSGSRVRLAHELRVSSRAFSGIQVPAFAGTTMGRSAPSEQAVEKPTVDATINRLRFHRWSAELRTELPVDLYRRHGRHRRGERRGGCQPRQSCDRYALMGGSHEA